MKSNDRRDSEQRLTLVETIVETLADDVTELTETVKSHVEEDHKTHSEFQRELAEGRMEMRIHANDNKHIAKTVAENTTELKKFIRQFAMVHGGVIVIGGIVAIVWGVLKFIMPLINTPGVV